MGGLEGKGKGRVGWRYNSRSLGTGQGGIYVGKIALHCIPCRALLVSENSVNQALHLVQLPAEGGSAACALLISLL